MKLSNTMDVDFCVEALEQALSQGQPEVFNTDQGSQFTSVAYIERSGMGDGLGIVPGKRASPGRDLGVDQRFGDFRLGRTVVAP